MIKLHCIQALRTEYFDDLFKARIYLIFIYTGVEVEFSFLPFVATTLVCFVSNPALDFFLRLCKLDCVNGPSAGAV